MRTRNVALLRAESKSSDEWHVGQNVIACRRNARERGECTIKRRNLAIFRSEFVGNQAKFKCKL